jgi:uncharacterized membrane protein YdbT with pleckstrin-like domain
MKSFEQKQPETGKIICESEKHYITYVFPILAIFLGLYLLFKTGLIVGLISKFIGITIILSAILNILAKIKSKWILLEDKLIIKTGFLSWKRIYFEIPIDTIFEAYYESNFFAKLFGYAHLNIRRTDGVSSRFGIKTMNNYEQMTFSINKLVKEFKAITLKSPQTTMTNSLSEELLKFVNLRDQKIISEEEFQIIKKKLLNGQQM